MTKTYTLTGMTCMSCVAKVKENLLAVSEIKEVQVSKEDSSVILNMTENIALNTLQTALGGSTSKYNISNIAPVLPIEPSVSWLTTYKPILIIFGFITGISIITATVNAEFSYMKFMNNFMAGFFLTFSFFKLLDVKSFANSYAMYDIVASKIKAYGFAYPFIELALGIAFLIQFNPLITNVVTLTVMTIGIIGVLKSVSKKQKIQCACLGSVFNLPMSTVTIIEDALMIAMSAAMLVLM
jgi:copper chaperone CopZ